MREHIEPSADRPPLRLPGRVLHELCQHALESLPEECCGLLAGAAPERFAATYRCRNEMTLKHRQDPIAFPRDGHHAYHMSETDLLKARRDAESRGQRVTAVYHSHVGAGAFFSQLDQHYASHALFPFPDAAQIVIAVWDRRVSQVGIFEPDLERGTYAGRFVEVREP